MNKIKILYLITGLARAGAEMQLLRIIENIDSNKFDTVVVSMTKEGTLRESYIKKNIKIYELSFKKKKLNVVELYKLNNIVKVENPDIINSFMFHANIISRFANIFFWGKKHISSIRTSNYTSFVRRILEKGTSKISDLVIVNSSLVANDLLNRRIIFSDNVKVIPNGLNSDSFYKSMEVRMINREKFNFLEGDFIWIAVGRFNKAKNYPILLDVFEKIVKKYPKTKLVIVGEGVEKQKCIELVEKNILKNKIIFLGLQDNINKLLNMADAYVLSSSWEGMPNSLLEAAFAELPIVTTDVGEASKIVIDNETGFVVKKDNKEELFTGMVKLMNMKEDVRIEFGKLGRENAFKNYDMSIIVKMWENEYLKLIN